MGGDKLTSKPTDQAPLPEQGSKLSLHFDASGAPQTRSAETSTEKSPFKTIDKQGDNSNSTNQIESYLALQERARAPYEVPKNLQEGQKNIARDREATNTAGIPKERTITTQTGEQIKGIKVVDDVTKEHRFIAADKDGKFNQYQIQENGKKLQPLDTSGKPVGDAIMTNKAKPMEGSRNTAEEAAKAMDGNGKRHELPEWASKRDGEKGRGENKESADKGNSTAKSQDGLKTDPAKSDAPKIDSPKGENKTNPDSTSTENPKPRQEWNRDKDGDGKPDSRPIRDRDGDGKPDFRPIRDRDGDGKPDFRPGKDRDGENKLDASKKDAGNKDAPKDQSKDNPKPDSTDPRGTRGEIDNTRFGKPIQPDAGEKPGQFQQPKQAQDWQKPDLGNRPNRNEFNNQTNPQKPDGPIPASNRNFENSNSRADGRPENPNLRPDGRPDFNGRPDRGDLQNRDFPGRRDFSGRDDVPGRRELGAREDLAGKFDLKGRVDMNSRTDFAAARTELANLNGAKGEPNLRAGRDIPGDLRADGGMRALDRALTADIMSRSNGHDLSGRDLIGRELAGKDFAGRGLDGRSLSQILDGQRLSLKDNTMQTFRSNADLLTNLNRSLGGSQLDSLSKPGGRSGIDGEHAGLSARGLDGKLADGRLSESKLDAKELGKSSSMLQNAMSELSGKMLATKLLDMTQKLEIGKIPNQEQTNNAIREMSRIQRNEMGTAQDLLSSIQKNLSQKNNEIASNSNNNNSFIAKNLEIGQQQALRSREQENNKEQKTETITKNVDSIANKSQQNQQNQILTAKNAESTSQSQTQKQEQTRTGRDAEEQTNQNAKNFQANQNLVQAEKTQDSKQDSITNKNQDNKLDDKKHLEDDKKTKQDLRDDSKQDQMAGLIAAAKLKELKDKEKGKEKEDIKDKSKQDPKQKTRLKYRVKKNDTLALIAEKFLGNSAHAASIFHINRTLIPVTTYSGKSFANPQVDSMIWIPTDDDIEIFKNSGVLKNYAEISFAGVTYASAEDELAARFGQRWFGPSDEEKRISRANFSDSDRQIRRTNIENQLGDFNPSNKELDGRIRYTVRLGETLKSIALKHPLLKDVEMWKLIARVNNLSEETDEKGCPLASLKRGTSIVLPTHEEAENFRASKPVRKPSSEQMMPVLPISEISAIMQG